MRYVIYERHLRVSPGMSLNDVTRTRPMGRGGGGGGSKNHPKFAWRHSLVASAERPLITIACCPGRSISDPRRIYIQTQTWPPFYSVYLALSEALVSSTIQLSSSSDTNNLKISIVDLPSWSAATSSTWSAISIDKNLRERETLERSLTKCKDWKYVKNSPKKYRHLPSPHGLNVKKLGGPHGQHIKNGLGTQHVKGRRD